MSNRYKKNKRVAIGMAMSLPLLIAAIFAPLIAPYTYTKTFTGSPLTSPTMEHWLGTDQYGRDVFSRIIYGSRVVLLTAFSVVLITALNGVVFGLVGGYSSRIVSTVIMRATDILFIIPTVLLALLLCMIVGRGLHTAIIALSITYTPIMIRLVCGECLKVLEEEYIKAAQAVGVSYGRMLFKHILPNIVGPILVEEGVIAAYAILQAATLSYLGIGAQPPTPSWGFMLSEGTRYMSVYPGLAIFPGLMIFYCIYTFNLLSDGIRDLFTERTFA